MKDLNPHKATGPDEVPSRILKIGAEELSPALVKLYQHSIDVGEVPQELRDVNVVPISKKGDRHQPSNYRPVSLTSMASQVHINSLNLSLNFKPRFENLKPRFKKFKPTFERKSAH